MSLYPEISPALRSRVDQGLTRILALEGKDAVIAVFVGETLDTKKRAVWIEGINGSFELRPKENFDLMRQVIDEVGRYGLERGCSEMRIEAQTRSGWKTSLLPKLGFVEGRYKGRLHMRKVLSDG